MQNKNKNTLYCFSPPVMIATIIIEIGLAIYSLIRLKSSNIKNTLVITLLLLAAFQFAEFFVCGNTSESSIKIASRIGYVAITFLPALGVLLANQIAERKRHWSSYVALGLAAVFATYFGLAPNSINSGICAGNYVIFNLIAPASIIYEAYYFITTAWIIGLGMTLPSKIKAKKRKQALQWLVIAVLSFIVPTGIVYMINPSTVRAIPSIMCGFAILYAFILTSKVVTKIS